MKQIYLDNSAATPVSKAVLKEMNRVAGLYGNPSSYNDRGREAREELEKARARVATFLGCHKDEVIFTGSGTESNNLAISGLAAANPTGGFITTPIEHPSVLRPFEKLAAEGRNVEYLKVDEFGKVDLHDLERRLNSDTVLVSVMYANNEIGTIEPIVKIGKLIKEFKSKNGGRGPWFHVDACQATEYLDIGPNRIGADLVTFNGSKIYGPRGLGVLYVRRGVKLSPLTLGGEQENNLRAGTENLMAIAGLAKALDEIDSEEGKRLSHLRDDLIEGVRRTLPEAVINGDFGHDRLPNNVSVSIPGLTSEVLLLELDKKGISAGSGSACTSHSVEPSHVLKAIGLEDRYLDGVIRFSLGRQTAAADIRYVVKVLPEIVSELKTRYGK